MVIGEGFLWMIGGGLVVGFLLLFAVPGTLALVKLKPREQRGPRAR